MFTTGPNSKWFHRIVPHDTLYQNMHKWIHWNKRAARAVDKKYLKTTSPPKPLVQIQNNCTELFLMMPSTKIAQIVLLHQTKEPPEL